MKKQSVHFMSLVIALILVSVNSFSQTNEIKNKSISLPDGVTEEWLNNIQDENGKRIATQPEDSGDAFQTRNFTGFNSGDEFGLSVSSAGDVNGDGYSDIIVGAPLFSSLYSYGGRAYIYYGGLNVNTIPDVILSGDAPNLYFGASVSTAGDVNGDGYSDVIVSATGFNNSGGKTLVFFGGAAMNNVAELTITGDNEYDQSGISISTAGDVNGDGYSDIIIGANGYDTTTGRASICLGGANMDPTPDILLTGDTASSNFGNSVASAGDVNNDGFGDVIVGASTHNGYRGSAYIFYGGASMNNVKDKSFFGQNANDNFGTSVSSAGDINGDSYSDIIISATGFNNSTGKVYLFNGGSNMDNVSDVSFNGENTFDYFGSSVSISGDLNADGYSDIMIGAPNNSNKGKVYFYYGGINMNSISDMTLSGETANSHYGNNTAFAGDMNGDGFPDLLVGAWGHNFNTGKVYLYMESMTGELFPDMTLNGQAINNSFGNTVSSAGDVNGDGFNDVMVSANYINSLLNGTVYIFFGGVNMDNTPDVILTGDPGTTSFGVSISKAGDVNGDGFSDVIVGNHRFNNKQGKVYIYYGGYIMDNVSDVTMTGVLANDEFGNSVSDAGDLNGDGYSDVIVGAPLTTVIGGAGKVYIYYGGSTMNNIADLRITGQANISFGVSVSEAGDVNGDGYADVIVGADRYSSFTGRAYIYFGSSVMDSITDVTLTGLSTSSFFGEVVSSAGDVNGDGYSDVIVGVPQLNRAYIFHGGSDMNSVLDVSVITPGSLADNFGISISPAGDINRDGFSDVIVGTIERPTLAGKAYILFGGINMSNTASITLSGGGITNYFGFSVSEAGDLNGDGSPDLIVGESGSNTNTGRASIYFTSTPSIKPNLVSIKDVPDDQGGFVKLKWVKSAYDVPVTGIITNYLIERSVPPGTSGYQWEQIGSVLPTQDNLYYYFTCSTPADSGINGNSTFYFRITAYTGSASTQYRSNIMSGSSIDNLAPVQVMAFSANPVSNNIRLNWNRNHESDLQNYIIYRSTSSTININSEPVFATVSDSTYLDTAPLTGVYYYFIVAQDIHSNKSPVVSSESQNVTINLTAFLEGFYNSSSDTQVSDTLRAYLRNSTAPYAIVDSSNSILSSNGSATLKFGNAATGNYYLVIKHRNSIETWSKSGGESLTRGSTVSYDFSNASSQAFGNNMKQVDSSPVRFSLFSGDENHDGFVDLTDVINVYNDGKVFATGYVNSDMNGDNVTDLTDLIITYNNSVNFVSVIRP